MWLLARPVNGHSRLMFEVDTFCVSLHGSVELGVVFCFKNVLHTESHIADVTFVLCSNCPLICQSCWNTFVLSKQEL